MTKIYGESDDLIEFEGDVFGEVGCYGTDDRERGVLIICSDGTLIEGKYGKGGSAIWEMKLLNAGTLFDHKDECTDEDAKIHSDVIHFKDGLKFAYAATDEWEKVS